MKTIILILSLFAVVGCNKDDDNNNFQSVEITPILISKGTIFNSNYYSTSEQNIIFNDESEWDYFVQNIWGIANPPIEADVDFTSYIVIVCIDQARATGGYELNISTIVENETNVVVNVEYNGDGDATQMPTRPYHFVKIPITDKEIIFE